jgi:hypothetical protein
MVQYPDEKPLIALVIINYRNDKTKRLQRHLAFENVTRMDLSRARACAQNKCIIREGREKVKEAEPHASRKKRTGQGRILRNTSSIPQA